MISYNLLMLRDKHHFNLGDLNEAAGLTRIVDASEHPLTRIIFHLPITREDASRVQAGLKKLTGIEYSVEELDILLCALEDEWI